MDKSRGLAGRGTKKKEKGRISLVEGRKRFSFFWSWLQLGVKKGERKLEERKGNNLVSRLVSLYLGKEGKSRVGLSFGCGREEREN